jgi:hypothetical protein
MILHGRQGGLDSLLSRGNKLTMMKGERKEERESFDEGISVEGEFAFTQAIGESAGGQ